MKANKQYCKTLGAVAFARGVERAPALDEEFAKYRGSRQISDSRTIPEMKAWLAGWDEANLAAEVVQ